MRAVIIGGRADGHAKVVLEILQAAGDVEVVGFVDDDPAKQDCPIRGLPVLGTTDAIPRLQAECGIEAAIVAIGDNPGRRALAAKARRLGLAIINAIHPTVHLDSEVKLGTGCVLCQGAIVVTGTTIGNCVNIHTGATIDHDNTIGDGANLGPGVHTAGRCRIEEDAFLGTGAVLIPDIVVGRGAVVGAGAVVIRNVPPGDRVVGVPAKSILTRGKPHG
jgi:UDP-perosamine 4-acetyltransferase